MAEFKRNLLKIIRKSNKSVLLLGPRQVGKSTLAAAMLPDIVVNLADEDVYLTFARNPKELRQLLAKKPSAKIVFVDEVQRLPGLLNTIQAIIDESKGEIRFILTGSSARKLRRGQANLLPGRALSMFMGPLVTSEFGNHNVELSELLSTGCLPGILKEKDQDERERVLRSYAGTYLKEEIQAEALTRNIEGFARFLFVAAAASGQFLDLQKLCSEAMIPYETARRYFDILEDTLVVHRVASFAKSARKRLVQHPRFFFFDVGVLNGLLDNFTASADRRGMLFENLIFNQILHTARSLDVPVRISTYRTDTDLEIDFIVEVHQRTYAIEVKSCERIDKVNLKPFVSFKDFYRKPFTAMICYAGNTQKAIGDVQVLPWRDLLEELFAKL